jgi:RimJ/RimL family protein N-acetyltransferase
MIITFTKLQEDDMPLLHQWLNEPFVNEWFGKSTPTLQEVQEKYRAYITGCMPTLAFLICLDGRPVGYIQTYRMEDYPDYNALIGYPHHAAMFDIFIGEKDFLHKGFGSLIMQRFIKEIVFPTFAVEHCLIGPEPTNTVAIRAYEKAGFRHYATITNADGTREYIMALTKQA